MAAAVHSDDDGEAEVGSSPADPVQSLRRLMAVAEHVKRNEPLPPDLARWLTYAVRRFADGDELPDAFGCTRRRGEHHPARVLARAAVAGLLRVAFDASPGRADWAKAQHVAARCRAADRLRGTGAVDSAIVEARAHGVPLPRSARAVLRAVGRN